VTETEYGPVLICYRELSSYMFATSLEIPSLIQYGRIDMICQDLGEECGHVPLEDGISYRRV
jgi:hypothetical protein